MTFQDVYERVRLGWAEIEKPLAFATATSSLVTCTLQNKTQRLEDELI